MSKRLRIKASFELDGEGRPKKIQHAGRNHYSVVLNLEDAPSEAYAVTYVLDETFLNPVREARAAGERFREKLQAYGDFRLQARVRTRQGHVLVATDLAEALQETYAGELDEGIQAAIQEIRGH